MYVYIYVCVYMSMCMCMCICVCAYVYVCMCVAKVKELSRTCENNDMVEIAMMRMTAKTVEKLHAILC